MINHSLDRDINAEDPSSYATPRIEPVHLWFSSREDIVTLRKTFSLQWLYASIELWILIFLISTLYIGAGHNPNRYTRNLDVAVVDFDGDVAGYYFVNAFRQSLPGNLTLNWRYKYASDYDNNVNTTRSDVDNGRVWAVVVLQPNTTRFINESLVAFTKATTLLTSPFAFAPSVFVLYGEGRNSYTTNNYVLPPIRAALATASAQYGLILRKQLINNLSSSSNSPNNQKSQVLNTFQLGSLLVNPLAAGYHNLHPVFPFVGQLATTLGYIYLYLITAMIVGSTIKVVSPFVGKVHYLDLLVYRVFNGFFQAFIISLIYSLIVLWFFGIHSGSLFMRYWMFNWLSVLIFGVIVAVFIVNLGLFANSLLTIFVVLMLATATIQISLELSPSFFRYGYGLPLYHIINGGRHLLFNSYERIGVDVGVMLAYFVGLWALASATSAYHTRKLQRKIVKKNQQPIANKKESSTAATLSH